MAFEFPLVTTVSKLGFQVQRTATCTPRIRIRMVPLRGNRDVSSLRLSQLRCTNSSYTGTINAEILLTGIPNKNFP